MTPQAEIEVVPTPRFKISVDPIRVRQVKAAPGTRRVSFSDGPLLLADLHRLDRNGVDGSGEWDRRRGVDVVVLDLDGVEPDAVPSLVVDAAASGHLVGVSGGSAAAVHSALEWGVSLVVLDASWSSAALTSIGRSGVVVVLPAGPPGGESAVATLLSRAGVDLSRAVFEVDATQVVQHAAAIAPPAEGFRYGVCFAPGDGSPTTDGWEIGVLTAMLSQGVATVRGVDPRRFHRICSVLAALNGLEPVS